MNAPPRTAGAAASGGPRIAYLVNQYPKTSHSFVRREIAALEALGAEVSRFALRANAEPLVEEADRRELARTRTVLSQGAPALLWASARTFLRRPAKFLRALGTTLRMARRGERGWLAHLAWLAEAAWLEAQLAREGIRHLHAHFGTNSAAVALLVERVGGPGYSFTAHGTESFDAPPLIALGTKIEHARFVVAVSEWGRAQLLRWAPPGSEHKIHVVRCGLDPDFLERAPAPPPPAPRIVCVARFSPEKGVGILIEALARLAAEGIACEARLVGDGELRPAIEAALRAHGLTERVHLHGWGDAAAVRAAIEASTLLVVPSLAEGLPVVLMESLALQRPAIASAVGAIPELVEPGVTGWLVPPGSAEHLAHALRTALACGTEHRHLLGQSGARRIAERHDARREAAKLLAHFQSALNAD